MVRTADSSLRVIGGKASHKSGITIRPGTSTKSSPSSSDKGTGGLNPICHWETPQWQKPITEFFKSKPVEKTSNGVAKDCAGSSLAVDDPIEDAQMNEEVLNLSDKENTVPPPVSMEVEINKNAGTAKRVAEEDVMEEDIMAPKKRKKIDKVYIYLEEMEKC